MRGIFMQVAKESTGPSLDSGLITAAGATILTLGAAVLFVVFVWWRTDVTWLRALVSVLALAIVVFGMVLTILDKRITSEADRQKDATLDSCLHTLDTVNGLVDAKLIAGDSAEYARRIAQQIRQALDETTCKRAP
jgi:hypothetical protein